MKNIFVIFALLGLVFLFTSCAGFADMTVFKDKNLTVDKSGYAVILNDNMSMNDMYFADVLSSCLLEQGINLIDRSVVEKSLTTLELNLNQIISSQQYFKLSSVEGLKTIIIVNAKMVGSMISTATCRVIDAKTGQLIMSMSVANPSPYSTIYVGNKNTIDIAKEWANNISN